MRLYAIGALALEISGFCNVGVKYEINFAPIPVFEGHQIVSAISPSGSDAADLGGEHDKGQSKE
jgi:hypothetical protein